MSIKPGTTNEPFRVCLVVPCFNEAARLDFTAFARLPPGVVSLLVDDGSRDQTLRLARQHESPRLKILALERNVGKAEAVRQGVLFARATGLLENMDWVGYWDADMATPFSEVDYMLRYASLAGGRVDAILGSRVYKLGSRIQRSFRRHLFGRLFATVSTNLLALDVYDSQCGAKLFRTDVVERAFGEPFVSRWIFDVELLMRLRDSRLIECPLREWTDTPGGTLQVHKIAARTLLDLMRIRRRYFGGAELAAKTLGTSRPHRSPE
jgi:glycosyltransferase involved in cell wall biosynthesis